MVAEIKKKRYGCRRKAQTFRAARTRRSGHTVSTSLEAKRMFKIGLEKKTRKSSLWFIHGKQLLESFEKVFNWSGVYLE